jgi:hypothetical protein
MPERSLPPPVRNPQLSIGSLHLSITKRHKCWKNHLCFFVAKKPDTRRMITRLISGFPAKISG